CLCLHAFFQTVLQGSCCLSFQGKFDSSGCKNVICGVKEGKDTSDAQIINGLIDYFFEHHGCQPCVQRTWNLQTEFINSLAADQCGSDRHVPGNLVKLLSLFIDNFVKS